MLDHPVELTGIWIEQRRCHDDRSRVEHFRHCTRRGRPACRAGDDRHLSGRQDVVAPRGLSSRRTATAAPARDGRYRLTGLPPGETFSLLPQGSLPDLSNHGTLAKLTSVSTRIQLGDSEARVQDLRAVEIR